MYVYNYFSLCVNDYYLYLKAELIPVLLKLSYMYMYI